MAEFSLHKAGAVQIQFQENPAPNRPPCRTTRIGDDHSDWVDSTLG